MRSTPVRTRHRYGLGVVVPTAGWLVPPDLPADVAMHWNAAGQHDGFASRWVALTLIPALGAVPLTLCSVFPRVGHLGENARQLRAVYD